MKKLFFIFILALLSSVIFAQKKSNYEKYWQAREDSLNKYDKEFTKADSAFSVEYDDLYYQPSKDAKKVKKHRRADVQEIIDTLVSENPDIQVNYVYNYDPYFYSYNIGRFYHGGFNYWMYSNSWYYSNWMYDPYDFYWDMRFSGYPYWSYNSYYLGFYGYNYWSPWRNYNHYGFNNYNHYNNNFYSHNGNNWNTNNRRSDGMNPIHYKTQTSSVQNRRPAENRRAYSPSYNQPRMNTRPQYNNSRVNTSTNNRRADVSTQTRTYSQPNRSDSRTQSRTYTAPTRSYNESRSYNNGGSDRRSSGSYSGGSSYSAPRSSGSSNFSSGSRSSGGSSYSSGGSSSGGRSSGGGRR